MKQFLFATTAIVAFAGAASAEVLLSGSAEMGVFSNDTDGDDDNFDGDIQFFTDIDVTFTLSGATDTGLTYGASIDLDESDGSDVGEDDDNQVTFNDADGDGVIDEGELTNSIPASQGASPAFVGDRQGGESIFISGGFGTLTMGDTDGALDWAVQETDTNATSLNDDQEHGGWEGNAGLDGTYDGQILRYDYTVGDFAFALSGEIDDNDAEDDGDDPVLGIGVRGSFDFAGSSIGFGVGYQDSGGADAIAVSANTTILSSYTLVLNYSQVDRGDTLADAEIDPGVDLVLGTADDVIITDADIVDSDFEHYGIGLGTNVGPVSLHANYGRKDFDDGTDVDGFGVTGGYELGDDIELQVGYGHTSGDGAIDDQDKFSFGVSMSF